MSVFGIRQYLARLIPVSIKIATGAGIGLYLCFIGMQSAAGIGLITADPSTLVTLGTHVNACYFISTVFCGSNS
jgi:AGZA family xanthine/uracil permease-like MFS transporter